MGSEMCIRDRDQVDRVIYDLKNNPYSRRIMTNIYVHQDLHEMNLYPCAYSMTFNVTKEKNSDKLTLNGILNQRSQDAVSYTHLRAHETDSYLVCRLLLEKKKTA